MKVTEKDVQYVAESGQPGTNARGTIEDGERPELDSRAHRSAEPARYERRPANGQTSDRFGIDPSKQGSERFGYVMREDEVRPCLPREVVMENAPDSDGAFFKVPKVIER